MTDDIQLPALPIGILFDRDFAQEYARDAVLADRERRNNDESDALTVAHMCGYEDGRKAATVKESVTVKDDLKDEIIRKLSAMNREQFKAHLESCGFELVDERGDFEYWICETVGIQRLQRTDNGEGEYIEPTIAAQWHAWQARAALAPVSEDAAQAVRWAPSSAYWSQRLVEIFGPDARKGINALEAQLRDAQQAQPVADKLADKLAEALRAFTVEIVPNNTRDHLWDDARSALAEYDRQRGGE